MSKLLIMICLDIRRVGVQEILRSSVQCLPIPPLYEIYWWYWIDISYFGLCASSVFDSAFPAFVFPCQAENIFAGSSLRNTTGARRSLFYSNQLGAMPKKRVSGLSYLCNGDVGPYKLRIHSWNVSQTCQCSCRRPWGIDEPCVRHYHRYISFDVEACR
jgi:hypothetical protein